MSIFEENDSNDDKFEDMFSDDSAGDQGGNSDENPEDSSNPPEDSGQEPEVVSKPADDSEGADLAAAGEGEDSEGADLAAGGEDDAEGVDLAAGEVADSDAETEPEIPLEDIVIGGPPAAPRSEPEPEVPLEDIVIGGPPVDLGPSSELSAGSSEDESAAEDKSVTSSSGDESVAEEQASVADTGAESVAADQSLASSSGDKSVAASGAESVAEDQSLASSSGDESVAASGDDSVAEDRSLASSSSSEPPAEDQSSAAKSGELPSVEEPALASESDGEPSAKDQSLVSSSGDRPSVEEPALASESGDESEAEEPAAAAAGDGSPAGEPALAADVAEQDRAAEPPAEDQSSASESGPHAAEQDPATEPAVGDWADGGGAETPEISFDPPADESTATGEFPDAPADLPEPGGLFGDEEEPPIEFQSETSDQAGEAGVPLPPSQPEPATIEPPDPFGDFGSESPQAGGIDAGAPDQFGGGAPDPFALIDDEQPGFAGGGGLEPPPEVPPYGAATSAGEFNPFSPLVEAPSPDPVDHQLDAGVREFGDFPDSAGGYPIESSQPENPQFGSFASSDDLGDPPDEPEPYDAFDQSRLPSDASVDDRVADEPASLDSESSDFSDEKFDLGSDAEEPQPDEAGFGALPIPGHVEDEPASPEPDSLSDGPWNPSDSFDPPLPSPPGEDPVDPKPLAEPKWSPQPLAAQQEYKVSSSKPKSNGTPASLPPSYALPPAAIAKSGRTLGPRFLILGGSVTALALLLTFGGLDLTGFVPSGVNATEITAALRSMPVVSMIFGAPEENAHVLVPTKEVVDTSELDPSEQDIDDLLGLGDAEGSADGLDEEDEEEEGIWLPSRRAVGTETNYERYRYLPNPLEVPKDIVRYWTEEEEEEFMESVTDERAWRRYEVVQQIRAERLAGTELIFWEAIYDETDWVRLAAVFGLVDLGIPISYKVVVRAFDDAHPKLVANFLKRFIDSPSAGGKFVLRMAVKVGAPQVRARALRLLAKYDYQFGQLYLSAATADSDERVKAFAEEWLEKLGQDRRDELLADMAEYRQTPPSESYVDFPKGYSQGYGKATSLVPVYNLKVIVPLH